MKINSRQSKFKTIVRFENGIEIKANYLNWVLYIPTVRSYWYYSSLEGLVSDLLTLKVKEIASEDSRKSIQSLADSIEKAYQYIKGILDPLMKVYIDDSGRLQMNGLRNRD